MRKTLLALALVALGPTAFGAIYKHVDEKGRITYSDQPPHTDAKTVELAPTNTVKTVKPAPAPTPAKASATPAAVSYRSVSLNGPEDGTQLRNPDGPVTVGVSSDPPLQPGHRYVILHNGQPANGEASTLVIPAIERGTHTFTGQVVDASGKVLIQSETRKLHVHRVSQLTNPGRPRPTPHAQKK